mmetsp:Transcript_36475/g.66836  ORF Transcript_36475/g.66836 Transcript_36475/m.66836 type:complete len:234 (+) Transcript_36475:59-760(+)
MLDNLRSLVVDAATSVQDGAAKGINAAQQRIESAKQGSHMLGNPQAEARVLAKKAAADAVLLDRCHVSKLQATIEAYEVASKLLSETAKMPIEKADTADDEGEDLGKLAEEYAARCMDLRAQLSVLLEPPQAPSITAAEQDAIVFLSTRKTRENITTAVSNQAGMAANNAAAGAGAMKGIVRRGTSSFSDSLGNFALRPAQATGGMEAPLAEPATPLAEETMIESPAPLTVDK